MDVFSPAKRSEIMRRVRSKGTTPELLVRRIVTRMGFRYRLNSKTLPGHPDLVFSRLHRVIFFREEPDLPWPVRPDAFGSR